MTQNNQLQDIAVLRCFATVSLVVWHSYCSYICWGVADTPVNNLYGWLFTKIIPDANMPLFTILAGYLFHYLLIEKGKYGEFKPFLKNKVNRLFIPFIVLGIIMNLTQYGKHIGDILYGQPNHLWYCLMLFYVYIVCWVTQKYFGERLNMILCIISFCVITIDGIGALSHRVFAGLYVPVYYYGYFYFGFLFRKNLNKWNQWGMPMKLLITTIIYILSCINSHLIGIASITYFLLLFTLVNSTIISPAIIGTGGTKYINTFSKYSFGIYVFHQYIIWNLTREPHCLAYIKPILENHYIIAPIIMVLLVLSIVRSA